MRSLGSFLPGSTLLLLASSLLAGGCVRTTQPILLDEQVTFDKALLGRWVSDGGKTAIEMTPGEDGRSYVAAYTEGGGAKGKFVTRVGKVGPLLVAEFAPHQAGGDNQSAQNVLLLPLYCFMILDKTGPDRISLRPMSEQWLREHLAEHPDALGVADSPSGRVVTASTEELQAFVKRHVNDKGALGEPELFVRPAGRVATRPASGDLTAADRAAVVADAGRAIRGHVRGEPRPADQADIARELWGPAIARLDPVRVRNDRGNVMIVLAGDDRTEQGLYVSIPYSSYAPGADGRFAAFESLSRPGDGGFGHLYRYRIEKPARQTPDERSSPFP